MATVCDFPDPVEPTIAICLLKNLFPLTGTSISKLDDNFANINLSFSSIDLEYIASMSSLVAGLTSLGGIAIVSPPRSKLLSLKMPKGLASNIYLLSGSPSAFIMLSIE